MFTYSPLSREKRETRFFRFTPACQSASDCISLQLRYASLDDDDLQYRALSYVWGDTKDKIGIEVNGGHFSVGENLHALLQMLQHHGVESWLWADAICIQQSDDDEKSWHVQSMCDIFKNAEFVYSWLGPSSEATDVAMNFFSDWGPRALEVGVMEKVWPTDTPMDDSFSSRLEVIIYLHKLERYFLPEPVFEKGGTIEDALSMDSEGLMRQDYPDPQTLPDFLVKLLQRSGELKALSSIRSSKRMNHAPIGKSSNPDDDTSRDATTIADRKTQTKSESVDPDGIGDVRPGDIVVILQNAHTPFILRPRPQDGDEIAADRGGSGSTFTFGGEAWVDGIMYGEFVDTEPKEEVFDIY
ncbi:hypothetical protein N0V85_008795 [Neurospora sp. IMI 360204]|nr:hypothetical protein N0V85_008795 [Neurospora sp. IMI 360204]